MGVRGIDELVAVLPPSAGDPARVVAQGLADLVSLRHSALAPEDVRALGEVWERFTAQVASGRLGVLAAMDARDDVIPKAKVGDAGAVFGTHVLGQRRGTARRDGVWAGLLRPEGGDLPAVGAAFAAGDVSAAHVEVVVRAHRDLGARVRETLMDCQPPTPTPSVLAPSVLTAPPMATASVLTVTPARTPMATAMRCWRGCGRRWRA